MGLHEKWEKETAADWLVEPSQVKLEPIGKVAKHETNTSYSFMELLNKARLEKFNQNHDPATGRFTSGPGGPKLAPDTGTNIGGRGGAATAAEPAKNPMIRTKDPPKKTKIGYKVFVARDGKLYPPMVANPDGADTPVGVWLDAQEGKKALNPDGTPMTNTLGRLKVQAGGKGTKGGSGTLAYRPGWHLGELPIATQFYTKNKQTGEKEMYPNFVWAECEIAADHDYQKEAMSYGYNKNGKFQHSLAGLPKIPTDGYYTYRTNPDPTTKPWYITGSMKVKRILTDDETDAILRSHGIEPMKRKGGKLDLKSLGFEETDFTVKKFNQNHDPATGRFTSGSGGSGASAGTETSSHGTNTSDEDKPPSGGSSGAQATSFTPATTTMEAAQYAKENLGFQIVDYSCAKMPGMWDSVNIDTVNMVNSTITDIQSKYPYLKGEVDKIFAVSPNTPEGRVMQCSYEDSNIGKTDSLEIGKMLWDGTSAAEASAKDDVAIGFHPPGTEDVKSYVWHEYGHILAHKVRTIEGGSVPDLMNNLAETKTEKSMVLEAGKKLGYKGSDEEICKNFAKKVSKYSEKNYGETFAEAFAEYNCSKNPRPECVALVEIATGKIKAYQDELDRREKEIEELKRSKGWI